VDFIPGKYYRVTEIRHGVCVFVPGHIVRCVRTAAEYKNYALMQRVSPKGIGRVWSPAADKYELLSPEEELLYRIGEQCLK